MDAEVLIDVEGENMDHDMAENNEPDKGGKLNVNEKISGREINIQDDDGSSKPHVGMEFESEDAAKTLYDAYGRNVGFSTHVGLFSHTKPDGPIVTWDYACSREVFKRKNVESCNAMLRIERKDANSWVATKFVEDHNHSMVSPSKVHYLRPRRHINGATKNTTETLDATTGAFFSMDGNHVSYEPNRGGRS